MAASTLHGLFCKIFLCSPCTHHADTDGDEIEPASEEDAVLAEETGKADLGEEGAGSFNCRTLRLCDWAWLHCTAIQLFSAAFCVATILYISYF